MNYVPVVARTFSNDTAITNTDLDGTHDDCSHQKNGTLLINNLILPVHEVHTRERLTNDLPYMFHFACFLSHEYQKEFYNKLLDPAVVNSKQEELLSSNSKTVWVLVDLPKGHRAIGTNGSTETRKMKGEVIRTKQDLLPRTYSKEALTNEEVIAPLG
ncbi:hypothetical protein Tco_0511667 [Tanacetum coccineum]